MWTAQVSNLAIFYSNICNAIQLNSRITPCNWFTRLVTLGLFIAKYLTVFIFFRHPSFDVVKERWSGYMKTSLIFSATPLKMNRTSALEHCMHAYLKSLVTRKLSPYELELSTKKNYFKASRTPHFRTNVAWKFSFSLSCHWTTFVWDRVLGIWLL